MHIGFSLGANVPTGVFALHAGVAAIFLSAAATNATAGDPIGPLLNALVGVLLLAAGVVTARIAERR